ncbi:MAG: flagellar basal body-associated FliL family protein [Puniceicoccaceae bacterium]
MAEEEQTPDSAPVGKSKGAPVPWIPLVLVLLFIPIITLGLVQFVVIPKLRSSLSDGGSPKADTHHVAEKKADSHGGGHGSKGGSHGGGHGSDKHGGGSSAAGDGTTVAYEDIITNVAGTMGTRFLKVSFQVVSHDPQLESILQMREAQVKDAIISTLSSRTIQELEVIGGRNSLRVALISSVNHAIGVNLVEELYFFDFIIQ